MTPRGRSALFLAGGIYLGAWIFGARALYPVAAGLALAVGLAVAWVRMSPLPERVRRQIGAGQLTEGENLHARVKVEFGPGMRPPGALLVERIGRLGVHTIPLDYAAGEASGRYVLRAVPRGRYLRSGSSVVIEDPFGFARAERALGEGGALVVYPRLVELAELFSESGTLRLSGSGRLLIRRPAGVELHSVREYQEGESLRAVHWPSTAKRARLMVKDLADAPRDDLAVVLDTRTPPSRRDIFDIQVRAAGSILRLYSRRGRSATLVVASRPPRTQRIRSNEGDWRLALELLAEAEPEGGGNLAAALGDDSAVAGRASDLVVVTAVVDAALGDTLLRRAHPAHVALVYVDAALRREPLLLRLQAAGVAVAVVRPGDDLAAGLGAGLASAAQG